MISNNWCLRPKVLLPEQAISTYLDVYRRCMRVRTSTSTQSLPCTNASGQITPLPHDAHHRAIDSAQSTASMTSRLVLVIGDLHIPDRALDIPAKVREVLISDS